MIAGRRWSSARPARLLYERAADLGLAEAAMALARTYDAAEPDQPYLRGVQPDAKEARRWCERARTGRTQCRGAAASTGWN
jgi:TPR repeat protein